MKPEMISPFPLQRNQKMHPNSNLPGSPASDVVPPMPRPAANNPPLISISADDLRALGHDAADLRESARRIEAAARNLQSVATASTIRLSRKEKFMVAGAAAGLVGVGVGVTLGVQAVRRKSAMKRSSPMVSVTTK